MYLVKKRRVPGIFTTTNKWPVCWVRVLSNQMIGFEDVHGCEVCRITPLPKRNGFFRGDPGIFP